MDFVECRIRYGKIENKTLCMLFMGPLQLSLNWMGVFLFTLMCVELNAMDLVLWIAKHLLWLNEFLQFLFIQHLAWYPTSPYFLIYLNQKLTVIMTCKFIDSFTQRNLKTLYKLGVGFSNLGMCNCLCTFISVCLIYTYKYPMHSCKSCAWVHGWPVKLPNQQCSQCK